MVKGHCLSTSLSIGTSHSLFRYVFIAWLGCRPLLLSSFVSSCFESTWAMYAEVYMNVPVCVSVWFLHVFKWQNLCFGTCKRLKSGKEGLAITYTNVLWITVCKPEVCLGFFSSTFRKMWSPVSTSSSEKQRPRFLQATTPQQHITPWQSPRHLATGTGGGRQMAAVISDPLLLQNQKDV